MSTPLLEEGHALTSEPSMSPTLSDAPVESLTDLSLASGVSDIVVTDDSVAAAAEPNAQPHLESDALLTEISAELDLEPPTSALHAPEQSDSMDSGMASADFEAWVGSDTPFPQPDGKPAPFTATVQANPRAAPNVVTATPPVPTLILERNQAEALHCQEEEEEEEAVARHPQQEHDATAHSRQQLQAAIEQQEQTVKAATKLRNRLRLCFSVEAEMLVRDPINGQVPTITKARKWLGYARG